MKTEKEILENLLLPHNKEWEISSINTDDQHEEVFVEMRYMPEYIEDNGKSYPIYDHRKARQWRHLDLWQYKTYLVAELPRYKDDKGNFKTVSIPWAEDYERMTLMLKKNDRHIIVDKKSE
jgi:transposase